MCTDAQSCYVMSRDLNITLMCLLFPFSTARLSIVYNIIIIIILLH